MKLLDRTPPNWHDSVPEYLEAIKEGCGPICNHKIPVQENEKPGLPPFVKKENIDCQALWGNKFNDMTQTREPPKRIPEEMRDDYLYNMKVKESSWYIHQVYHGTKGRIPIWTKKLIEDLISQAKEKRLEGTYGMPQVSDQVFRALLKMNVTGQSVLVIGSENPWIESLCLLAGALKVTTLEYGEIKSEHPDISIVTPAEMRRKVLKGEINSETFDAIVSFSSVEHSGLGRYGDALNPWGDRITIAKAWCVSKPNAKMLLGVPTVGGSNDEIIWTAHRIYGDVMMPHLAANWKAYHQFLPHGTLGGYLFQKIH